MHTPRFRLGIDIGGTFTDLSVLDETTGERIEFKTPTVPDAPARGVENGLRQLADLGVEPAGIGYFVHGTTIALNALIQRRGARVALLVTEGFRDVLEQARLRIPIPYDFYAHRTVPLVPRERVLPVHERTGPAGPLLPLDDTECRRVAGQIGALEPDAVVIALLHSYAHPAHERRLAEHLRTAFPGLPVFASAEVWPQMREYERTMVAVMNAFVQPTLSAYLSELESALAAAGVTVRPYITRSNGGIMTVGSAKDRPIDTLLSGPASGVTGAVEAAAASGLRDLVTLDMGGTSADVSIVEHGVPELSRAEEIEDLPVIVPAIGISAIGAGGGSIAWIDSVGVLRVGPDSAGAVPGPAGYGLGGTRPALSDAFLEAGYLNPGAFAGKARLDVDAARTALATLAGPLGLDTAQTAEAVIKVAVANMYTELSGVVERRGIDPRDFTLVAFGGAGPVVAALLAGEMRFARVLVPLSPGTLCARGALGAPVMSDFVRSVPWALAEAPPTDLPAQLGRLRAEAREWITEQAPASAGHRLTWSASCRYVGQAHEIDLPVEPEWLAAEGAPHLAKAFHDRHRQLFSHADPDAPVELIEIRARVTGDQPAAVETPEPSPRDGELTAFTTRAILVDGTRHEARCYRRADLRDGDVLGGPAIVEQSDTTVLVPPGWLARTDHARNLLLEGPSA